MLQPSRRVRRGSASCQRKLCDPHWTHAEPCRVRRHAEDDPTGAAMDGMKPNHPLRRAPAQRIAGAHAVLCAVRSFPRCKATQQSALPHLSHARSTSAACCATCGIPCVCHIRRRCTGCRVVAALHVARRLASSSCRASRRSFRRSQSPAHARPRRPSRAGVRGSASRSQLSPAGENREGSVQSTVGVAVRCAIVPCGPAL